MLSISRRTFLTATTAMLAAAPLKPALAALEPSGSRALSLHNIHTGEHLAIDYWQDGVYRPEALTAINHVLRDFRTGDVHAIEPALLDLLAGLHGRLETAQPFEVISGYRAPATNAMLRSEHDHSGVASKSLHMQGMAIDIRVPGRALDRLRDAALAAQVGGVGYYPQSDFVHVDVGRVRRW